MNFAAPRYPIIALTILRIALGAVFLVHGAQKVFVFGHAGVAGGFAQMGVPMASTSALIVEIVELAGGIALLLGLFTRIAALLLAFDMLGAFILVHGKAGFFLPTGYEYVVVLFAGLVALVVGGAGAYALDNPMLRRRQA